MTNQQFYLQTRTTSGREGQGAANHDKTGLAAQPGFIDRVAQLDFEEGASKVSSEYKRQPPRTVAILPFENMAMLSGAAHREPLLHGDAFDDSSEESSHQPDPALEAWLVAEALRRTFYGTFAPRSFQDVELAHVDRELQLAGIITAQTLRRTSPKYLGNILGADALIYGRITRYGSVYAVLYARVSVGLRVTMVSARSGGVLWEAEAVQHGNKVKLAFGPISAGIGALQNLVALRQSSYAPVMQALCAKLVAGLPKPQPRQAPLRWQPPPLPPAKPRKPLSQPQSRLPLPLRNG